MLKLEQVIENELQKMFKKHSNDIIDEEIKKAQENIERRIRTAMSTLAIDIFDYCEIRSLDNKIIIEVRREFLESQAEKEKS